MDARGATRPPRSYHRSQADARRYQRVGVVYMVSIYAALVAAMLDWISLAVMTPIVVVAYVRGALLTHELMHVRRPEHVTWLLRMMMIFETPLGLGYREHQNIHLRHHQRTATAADPEFFQIRGGRLRALAAALLSPELAAIKWVSTRGISATLKREASIKCFIMLTLIAVDSSVFLSYWIVVRLTVGLSNYGFHHILHYRGGTYGTFRLELWAPIRAAMVVVLGPAMTAVLCEHDAHHAWQGVKAERLPGLLRAYPPTGGHP